MPRTAPLIRRSAALLFAGALATLTACGGSDGGDTAASPSSPAASSSAATEDSGSASSSAPAGETQQITATEADFSITLDSTDLAAGDYDIEVVNDGGATHDLVVERDGEAVAQTESIAPGASGTLSVTLEPGEYVFYCSVGNHRGQGMEVPVTVT